MFGPAAAAHESLVNASPSSSPSSPAAGDRIGRFIVVDALGQGAMGVVVRAFDPRLERLLAIKLVAAERSERVGLARERLIAEARALARLSHPNVVAVYEVDVHEGRDYVAMELIDGIDLQRWLRERQRPWREVTRVFAAAAEGLDAVHRAGLVHRDVKPANILIGHDGHVRVGDFGIARRVDTGSPGDPETGTTDSVPTAQGLTEDGRVVGTPQYMAPEQHAGDAVGPAADQYALCVSLFEALWGRPPFLVPAVSLPLAKQTPPSAPPHRGVPKWLFRIVARGLHADPAQRHASCRALAVALAGDPRGRRAALGVAGVAVAAVVVAAPWLHRDPVCEGGRTQLAELWNPAMRASLQQSLDASGRPYAKTLGADVSARLDDYGARWAAMYTEACEATRVRGEQSEALLDRRMICLARRRDRLSATLELLTEGGDDTIDAAFTLVGRLPALAPCADLAALEASIAPPDDPSIRAEVAEVRSAVARTRATYDAGRYAEALSLAEELVTRARGLGYEPLLAEALVARGDVLLVLGRVDDARNDLQEATWSAVGIGHDLVAVDAATSMVWLESESVRDSVAAQRWVEILRAELRRSGDAPATAARAANAIGVSMSNAGRWDEALVEYERGLSNIAGDPAEAYTAFTLRVNIANVYSARGDGPRAREIYERELEGLEAMIGRDHPTVNILRRLLSDVLSEGGELQRAHELGEAALASLQRVHGEHGVDVAATLVSLALTAGRAGHDDEALARYRRARDLFEEVGNLPGLAMTLGNIGSIEIDRGAYDAADVALDRALAILRELHVGDHPDLVFPLVNKAQILQAQGRLSEAEAMAAEAERIATATLDPLAHERIVAKGIHQVVLADAGRKDESLDLAREVLDLATRSSDIRVATRPLASLRLADLLTDSGRPDEALALVDEALALLGTAVEHELTVDLSVARAEALHGLGRETEARTVARGALAEASRLALPDARRRASALLDALPK